MTWDVEDLAEHTGLPEDFLREQGVKRNGEGLRIPYPLPDGTEADKYRLRKSEDGWKWRGDGEVKPLGLDDWKAESYGVIPEGESDTWTLEYCGINALGIPGASMTGKLLPEHIEGIDKLLIHREPDGGGDTFVSDIKERLREIGWSGELAVFTAGEDMDINDLYQAEGKAALRDVVKEAYKDTEPFPENFELDEADDNPPSDPSENINAGGVSSAGWDEPDTGPATVDPLPADHLPDWNEDFLRNLSGYTQTPLDMAVMYSFSILATATQGKYRVKMPGFDQPLCFYGATILPPANRKSAVVKELEAPIEKYETQRREKVSEIRQKAQDKHDVLEEKMKRAKKGVINDGGTDADMGAVHEIREQLEQVHVPAIPALIAQDSTPEDLTQKLAEQDGTRIAVLSPEGEILRVISGHYSQKDQANLTLLKKAYDTERLRQGRIGRDSTTVENPRLSIGVTLQPAVLQDLKNSRAFQGQGVLGRFCYACPDSPVGQRKTGRDKPEKDAEAFLSYKQAVKNLLELEPKSSKNGEWTPHTLELTDNTRERYYSFEEHVERELGSEGRLETFPDWGGKLTGRVARIAGLLHLADHAEDTPPPLEIPADTFERAVNFVWKMVPHAKRAYQELQRSEHDELKETVLERILSKVEGGTVRYRTIEQSFGNHSSITSSRLQDEILPDLTRDNCIQVQTVETDGRPRTEIEVNPKLLSKTDPPEKCSQKGGSVLKNPPSENNENKNRGGSSSEQDQDDGGEPKRW